MQLKCVVVAAVLTLSVMAGSINGELQDRLNAGKHDRTGHEKFPYKGIRRDERLWFKGRRGTNRHENNGTADVVDSTSRKFWFDKKRLPGDASKHHIRTAPGTNPGQGQGQGFIHDQGYVSRSGYLIHMDKMSGQGHWHGHVNGGLSRAKRALSTKRPDVKQPGGINRLRGITYTWTRDIDTGKSFNEAAFRSQDKNVVVVLSFDDSLKDSNLTAAATLYDFTGNSGVMAIKPRMRPGPCFLVETSLTFDKIIAELETRNGSSVSTSTVISIDGTSSPVLRSETEAIVKKTPSMNRHCSGRKIIRTRPKGFSPIQPEGQTKELKVLTIDAEMTITVPVDPDLDLGLVNRWIDGQRKNTRLDKGQGFWKGP